MLKFLLQDFIKCKKYTYVYIHIKSLFLSLRRRHKYPACMFYISKYKIYLIYATFKLEHMFYLITLRV